MADFGMALLITMDRDGKHAEKRALRLLANPPRYFDFNKPYNGFPLLHQAIFRKCYEVFFRLLEIPGIDFRSKGKTGRTWWRYPKSSDEALMWLNDPRTDCSILCQMFSGEGLGDYLFASLRRLPDLQALSAGRPGDHLVKKYLKNAVGCATRCRKNVGWEAIGPLSVFLFVVLFCDGYFTLREPRTLLQKRATRFMRIMLRLPMELQQIVCNRMFRQKPNFITAKAVDWGLSIYVADGWLGDE